jgi:hypothetical protein
MAVPPRRFDFDWRRLSRWCWLGAIVMVVWLMVPVARCSYRAFRDTPLTSVDDDSPGQADKERVDKGKGFASSFGDSVRQCYLRTPLLDQEWKSQLLLAFVAAGIATTIVHRVLEHRRKTFT